MFTSKEPQQCCPVPHADIAFCGSSCKYFSNMHFHKKYGSSSEMLGNPAASNHSSYVTFKGFIAYVEAHRPSIFVWENVEAVAENSKTEEGMENSCLAHFNRTCAPLGYMIQTMLTDSSRFFIPQSRRRIYIIGALRQSDLFDSSTLDGDEFAKSLRGHISQIDNSGPPL
eukprot:10180360-Karenia_brevis.AAC.1